MPAYLNRCIWRPTSGGTGTWTVSAAVPGYEAPAGCSNPSVVDQQTYMYFAESDDRTQWEVGSGVYTVSGTTLTRATINDSTNAGAAVNFTSPPKVMMGCFLADSIRDKLTANRTYFVRTDGNDSNSGLVNSSSGAFLTIQKAINVAATLDLAGNTVTIQVGAGTYTGAITVAAPFVGGNVLLQGDTTTPSNVVISVTSANAISVSGSGVFISIGGFKVTTTTTGSGIDVGYFSAVNFSGKMEWGTCAYHHMIVSQHSLIAITANYDVSGSALAHIVAQQHSAVVAINLSIAFSNTPAWNASYAGLLSTDAAGLIYYGHTITGTGATGKRYSATLNGIINVNGGGANFFPGNVAGTTATGGQYA